MEEMVIAIHSLHEKIEQAEKEYSSAIKGNCNFNTLREMRTKIGILKKEVAQLEQSLVDKFRNQLQQL